MGRLRAGVENLAVASRGSGEAVQREHDVAVSDVRRPFSSSPVLCRSDGDSGMVSWPCPSTLLCVQCCDALWAQICDARSLPPTDELTNRADLAERCIALHLYLCPALC
jgi:hypothetical protein